MAYGNTPGVKATYLDGAFRTPVTSSQPKILSIGTAQSGLTYELFNVGNVRQAEVEFGANTEVLKGVHEVIAQGADNAAIMRIGGRKGTFVLTDDVGGTLTITPEGRDDEIMDRYALILEDNSGVQRIVVYDLIDEAFVYDSDETLVLDEGVVSVISSTFDIFQTTTGGIVVNDATTFKSFTDMVVGDFTAGATAVATAVSTAVATQGTDGQSPTLVERYAALAQAYHLLDYRDADMVYPVGVYIDDDNVADGDTPSFWAGPPLAGSGGDALGYLWQYIYRGKVYTYFTEASDYFTQGAATASSANPAVATGLTLTAVRDTVTADGQFSIQTTAGGTSPIGISDVTITETNGVIAVVADIEAGVSTETEAASAINLALAAFTMSNGLTADTALIAAGTVAAIAGAEAAVVSSGATAGSSAAVTHAELTGDTVPAAVDTTAFTTNGTDAQLRECNFAHQLADMCWRASTTWQTMLGAINTKAPSGLDRLTVADWVGTAPTYTIGPDGSQEIIEATASNGDGLFGIKLMSGQYIGAGGYRNGIIVDAGSVSDGLAYGGLIKTVGASLPNALDFPDHAYGVSDADERLDGNGKPVDIGKHIFVCYDWPILRNAFNGGTSYRGAVASTLLGKLSTMPENEEPIGIDNGRVQKLTAPPRIHATQLDQLARTRMVGLRREEGVGYIFLTSKTAAHPYSDYSRVSTIRSVNREIQGIRRIAAPYIGKAFSAQRLVALQSAIDVFLQAERQAGFNQGARASLSFTRSDKIMGKLKVKLRMVPPFSIEEITVETSLAADESEL